MTFYKNKDCEGIGSTYNNKNVTAIYSGFENTDYTSACEVPWNGKASSIKSVEVKEEINPISLSYWFYGLTNTSTLNLEKLNTREVTNMSYTFYNTGYNVSSFSMDVSNWDVSKVTSYSFFNVGVTTKVVSPMWVNENIYIEES